MNRFSIQLIDVIPILNKQNKFRMLYKLHTEKHGEVFRDLTVFVNDKNQYVLLSENLIETSALAMAYEYEKLRINKWKY